MSKVTESLNLTLKGVNKKLVQVVLRASAISKVGFTIVEGVRTKERQKRLFEQKRTKTMNSKHLLQKDGTGHAVDIYPNLKGKMVNDWTVPWLSEKESKQAWADLASAMKQAASELGVQIQWGGDWVKFKDGPHWELKES